MIELPPVEVKENDVCVKMLAAPINPSDINRIEGLFCSLFFFLHRSMKIALGQNCSSQLTACTFR